MNILKFKGLYGELATIYHSSCSFELKHRMVFERDLLNDLISEGLLPMKEYSLEEIYITCTKKIDYLLDTQ